MMNDVFCFAKYEGSFLRRKKRFIKIKAVEALASTAFFLHICPWANTSHGVAVLHARSALHCANGATSLQNAIGVLHINPPPSRVTACGKPCYARWASIIGITAPNVPTEAETSQSLHPSGRSAKQPPNPYFESL
jgi:hypothetical protein